MVDCFESSPNVAAAVRTLLAGGYSLDGGAERQPTHIEIRCAKPSVLGVEVYFLVAITEATEFSTEQVEDIRRSATSERRIPVFVGGDSTDSQLGWLEFLSSLGGEVPSWRALSPTYPSGLTTAATNRLPPLTMGEAWLVFEDLVTDGLEFVFGRRAHRFGGRRRGKRVSDIVAPLPTSELLVVDTKAAANAFDANWPALRALVEYVKKQQGRQRGYNVVQSALIVSSSFTQHGTTLQELSNQFLAEAQVPLNFMTAQVLATMVGRIQSSTDIRAAINWKRLFAGGPVIVDSFERELAEAVSERIRVSEY